jgi:hypothetical protein
MVATCEAFAGSPAPHSSASFFSVDCFIAAGGTAGAYNLCNGHPITGAEAGERYSNLPPRQQVAADVAAEKLTSQHRQGVNRFGENVR